MVVALVGACALFALCSILFFRRLSRDAGAEMSGPSRRARAAALDAAE
jgi:hypothetical protein